MEQEKEFDLEKITLERDSAKAGFGDTKKEPKVFVTIVLNCS